MFPVLLCSPCFYVPRPAMFPVLLCSLSFYVPHPAKCHVLLCAVACPVPVEGSSPPLNIVPKHWKTPVPKILRAPLSCFLLCSGWSVFEGISRVRTIVLPLHLALHGSEGGGTWATCPTDSWALWEKPGDPYVHDSIIK